MAVRVLILDDSLIFRSRIRIGLSKCDCVQVVGSVASGAEAIKQMNELKVDALIVNFDMQLLNFDELFNKTNCKIAIIGIGKLSQKARKVPFAGEFAFVQKPTDEDQETANTFFAKLQALIVEKSKPKSESLSEIVAKNTAQVKSMDLKNLEAKSEETIFQNDRVVAIGASTGGTEAIIEVVKHFPKEMVGVVIVQHMPPIFTSLYANRLNLVCKMEVIEAKDGDRIEQGRIILAAGDSHMHVKKDALGYYIKSAPGERVSGHCPSVDVLFNSVADVVGSKALGVILTGMGYDGAKGLLNMRNKGAYTIGQDKESSIVYGMPMEAFKLGAVAKQLPLDRIGSEIVNKLSK